MAGLLHMHVGCGMTVRKKEQGKGEMEMAM
jgi:hypothetical protein